MLIVAPTIRIRPYSLCAILLSQICFSQVPVSDTSTKEVLQWSEAEQTTFVASVMDRTFPESDGDRFSFLLVNRSSLVVPMVETRLEQEWNLSPRSERFVELAAAMIAYAGDAESLRAASKLIAIDESTFGSLVGRTLDNASNWRNPFTVAYRAFDIGDAAVARYTVRWSESALSSERMKRLWAGAMLDEYRKVPGDVEWARDPLASRLKPPQTDQLREGVLRSAAEAQAKREKQ